MSLSWRSLGERRSFGKSRLPQCQIIRQDAPSRDNNSALIIASSTSRLLASISTVTQEHVCSGLVGTIFTPIGPCACWPRGSTAQPRTPRPFSPNFPSPSPAAMQDIPHTWLRQATRRRSTPPFETCSHFERFVPFYLVHLLSSRVDFSAGLARY